MKRQITFCLAHIATVGKAFSSSEEIAYPLLQKHDVSYVLVLFGSLIHYSGDDINKFLWMIRIASGVWPDEIRESDFFTPRGEFRVDEHATKTMSDSLMYKMAYYRCVITCLVVALPLMILNSESVSKSFSARDRHRIASEIKNYRQWARPSITSVSRLVDGRMRAPIVSTHR